MNKKNGRNKELDFLIGAAETYKALERYETALIYCNKALRLEPNHPTGKKIKSDILYQQGVLFYNEAKYIDAIDNFRIVIKLSPQKLDSYRKIINAYNQLKCEFRIRKSEVRLNLE